MLQAQEMFSNSNKLTRSEKAQILGFIAGSRGNKIECFIFAPYLIHFPVL
jgi:hypothetical protein